MNRLVRTVGVGALALFLLSSAVAQDKTKNYKQLDQDAVKLFKQGKYEDAHKVWKYIHKDYPRTEFRELRDQDPRFIAWQIAFHMSIIREGLAKKQALLQSPDPAVRAKAEAAYTDSLDTAKEMMRRRDVPKATQTKLIKAATQPLLDALKKKNEPDKKK
jgi:hypothetical protein